MDFKLQHNSFCSLRQFRKDGYTPLKMNILVKENPVELTKKNTAVLMET